MSIVSCRRLLLLSGFFLLQSNHVNSFEEKKFTGGNGTIETKLVDGRYSNNLHVVYTVKVQEGKRAKLTFKTFDISGAMPNCTTDSLEIFVGCKNMSLGKFCGQDKPFDIYSKDECIRLVFKTDQSCGKTDKGFKAEYSSVDSKTAVSSSQACTNLNHNKSGNFFSPLWPNQYVPGLSCTWKLTIPKDYSSARVYFMNFRIEDNYLCNPTSEVDDYVRITVSNGAKNETVEQRLCSSYKDSTFSVDIFKGRTVYVTFFTDKDNVTSEQTGFAAGFLSYHTGAPLGQYTCTASEISVQNALMVVSLLLGVLVILK